MKINVADALMHTTSSEETVVSAGFTDLSRAAGWPPMSRHINIIIIGCIGGIHVAVEVGRAEEKGTWATNVIED